MFAFTKTRSFFNLPFISGVPDIEDPFWITTLRGSRSPDSLVRWMTVLSNPVDCLTTIVRRGFEPDVSSVEVFSEELLFSPFSFLLKQNVELMAETVSSHPVTSLCTPGERSGIKDLL